MRALIFCVSVSHGNTRKVADAIGAAVGAEVMDPDLMRPGDVTGYDLLGFGSGIYGMNFHPRLWRFVTGLPAGHGTPVFLFATSGGGPIMWRPAAILLGRLLAAKGYRVVDTFSCRGFDTWLPLRLVGGINKGRPGPADLAAAGRFGERLRQRVASRSERAGGHKRLRAEPASPEPELSRSEPEPSRSEPEPSRSEPEPSRSEPEPSEPARLRATRQTGTGSTATRSGAPRGRRPVAH